MTSVEYSCTVRFVHSILGDFYLANPNYFLNSKSPRSKLSFGVRVQSNLFILFCGGSFRRSLWSAKPAQWSSVQARQSTEAGNVFILSSLAGRYGYSAERAEQSKVRQKLPESQTWISLYNAPSTSSCHILAAKPSPVKSNSHEVH